MLTVVGITFLLAACGSGGSTSSQSPKADSSTPTASSSTPATSTSGKLGADAEACALVTADEAKSVLGELQRAPSPPASGPTAGPPGMLKASACEYRSQGGNMTLILARFTDSAAAHAGLAQFPSQGSGPPNSQPQPISGVGDEAMGSVGPLPSPYSGATGFFYAVRKGAVAFVLGGVVLSNGPADVPGAALALAKKAAAKL